jgi:cytochrome P450
MSANQRGSDRRWTALEPFPWYESMREVAPVCQDPSSGSWMVFGYDDVQTVLSDHQRFSSEIGWFILLNTDPPRHRLLRNLVTQGFTPRAVEALRPRIGQIVDGLLDRVEGVGRMDLIEDLAVPLPVTVIAELLGIPIEDRERFKRWSNGIVSGPEPGQPNARAEMTAYFSSLMDKRRREPRQDLVSTLMAATVDGERLTDADLFSFYILLLVAGNETTTNLIGNAVICLDRHPGATARLRGRPDLLGGAIEEVLRYRSPIQSMYRVTRSEVQIGGRTIGPGESVLAFIGSANRDPAQFPNPDRFDIERTPNRHLAFGHGIHFCLGAPLARLEARIALEALLRRLPGLAVAGDNTPLPVRSGIFHGVTSLPVTF